LVLTAKGVIRLAEVSNLGRSPPGSADLAPRIV